MTEYFQPHGIPEPYATEIGEWIIGLCKKFLIFAGGMLSITIIGFFFYFGGTFGIWCGTNLIKYFGG